MVEYGCVVVKHIHRLAQWRSFRRVLFAPGPVVSSGLSRRRVMASVASFAGVSACNSLPGSGPTSSDISAASRPTKEGGTRFALVDVDPAVVGVMDGWAAASLQGSFGQQRAVSTQSIGVGDYVRVVIWEASSGGLFSAPANDRITPGPRSAVIPEQVVGSDGAITVPFAGRVSVLNRTPQQVEVAIVGALNGKAVEPQALVTVTKNVANTVTVIGEVTNGARVPLTTRSDRLLDVIATAGGIKAPAYETFVTLARGGSAVRIPMQAMFQDPAENVFVRPGDVVTVTREPQTFTAAGATGANAVIPFDAIGITLDQAIARAGGLNDNRADPAGVFVIRYERPVEYDQLGLRRPDPVTRGQVPVIYRVNMRDPDGFFLARRFPVRNRDIVFVSNAASMELQKVMTILLPFLGAGASAAAAGAVATPH